MKREEIRALWKLHGGGQLGPHTETMTIPESRFWEFIKALLEKAHGGYNE